MNDVLIMKDLLMDSPGYLIGLMRSSLVEFGPRLELVRLNVAFC